MEKRKWKLVAGGAIFYLLFSIFCPSAKAQGGYAGGGPFPVFKYVGGQAQPAVGATITVCATTVALVGNPPGGPICPSQENDANCCFSDLALTQRLNSGQPFPVDSRGNVTFTAVPGAYQLSVTGSGILSYTETVSVPCVPGNTVQCGGFTNAVNNWSAAQTFVQSITAPNIGYKTPFDYGAKGDGVKLSGCSITVGTAVLNCPGATFTTGTAATVGNPIEVDGAGATSGGSLNVSCTAAVPCALVTTILSVQSATQLTLNTNAITTVPSGVVRYGTDDRAAIASCIQNGTLQGGRCTLNNNKRFTVSDTASTINFFSLNSTPVPNGIIDGAGTIQFFPQGSLTGGTNDRLFYILSNSLGPFQLAGNAKYTIANSPTGAVAGGAGNQTVTITTTASYGADIATGRCITITGVGVAGYNGTFTIASTPTGTTFTYQLPQGIGTALAASGGGSVSDAICIGDTTFTMQNSGDAAQLVNGQWIVLREHDSGAGDVIHADWMQVKTVVGTLVTVVNPFRKVFPNARTWATAGGTCSAANPCGLGVIPLPPAGLMQGYKLTDFTIEIPKVEDNTLHNGLVGIASTLSRGMNFSNHICQNASQNCLFNYLTQGNVTEGNHFYTAVGNEQASDVDFITIGNYINLPDSLTTGLPQAPTGVGWDLDFGSAFGTFSSNAFGSCLNECIAALAGPYYTSIADNSFGWLVGNPGGALIQIAGGIGNNIHDNHGIGGTSTTTGVNVGDPSIFTIVQNSDGNDVHDNYMNGFPGGNYSCTGAWNTDACSGSVPVTATGGLQGMQIGGAVPGTSGALQIAFNSNLRNAIGIQDIGPASNRHKYEFSPGALGVNVFSLVDTTSGKQAWNCYENASNMCSFPNGIGVNSNTVLFFGTAPTISTHFNTSGDSIVTNGTGSITITVGTGTGTSTGAIALPTATTGWNCWLTNQNRAAQIQQTGSTTASATFTNFGTTFAATNWTNGDVLKGGCVAN